MLLPLLGLPPPQTVLSTGPVSAKTTGKLPRSTVDMDGEVQTARVVKLSLGAIRWPGHTGELLAFTDADGKLVTNGPRPGWRAMATGNMMGGRIVHALADLGALEERWRAGVEEIGKATAAGAGLLKRVEAARDTFLKQKAKNTAFRQAMVAYFAKLEELPELKEDIVKATEKLNASLGRLGAEVANEKILVIEEEIQKTEGDIAAVKAEAQAIKDGVAKVLGFASKMQDFASAPGPEKAISMLSEGVQMVADKIIDLQFTEALTKLELALEDSKAALGKTKHAKNFQLISAAQAEVKAALSDCRRSDLVFARKIRELVVARADAQDRAGDQKETRVFGEAITQRANQRARISVHRSRCETFLAVVQPLSENVPKVRDKYGNVSDWIADVAAADSKLAADTPWGRQAELVGRHNAVELGEWTARVETVKADCRKALATVEGGASVAATRPYDDAVQMINDLLGESAAAGSTAPAGGG